MSRRKNRQSEGDREVAVDATLEFDLRAAEDAVDAYLEEPSATRRERLLAVLQRLDQQIALSDDYESRIAGVYRVLALGTYPGVGEFVEVVPDHKVVFTFGWDEPNHPIPARSTEVEITLTADGDKTRVRLVHRGLPDDAVNDHTQGWDHYLDRLAIVSAGGVVGPDVSPEAS